MRCLWLYLFAGVLAGCSSRAVEELIAPVEVQIGSSPTIEPITSNSLVVGSYNVQWLDRPEMIAADLRAWPHVQVCCLQEVRFDADTFKSDPAKKVADRLAPVLPPGRWHLAVAATNRLAERRSRDWEAQVIASRSPISGVEVWPVDTASDKKRVALAGSVLLDGERIRIVNVDHAPSFFAWRDGNRRQVNALLDRLGPEPSTPTILAGDFNAAGNLFRLVTHRAHLGRLKRAMGDLGFRPVFENLETFRAGWLRMSLDQAFTRGLVVVRQGYAEKYGGSDHRPIWFEVVIDPAATNPCAITPPR